MKNYFLPIFILFALACKGQDSAKHLSKSSISIGGGINISYPTTITIPGGPWGGEPVGGTGTYFTLGYSYSLLHSKNIEFGCKAGMDYTQYRYNGKFAFEIEYGPPILIEQLNEGELFTGIFTNTTIFNIGWYNELDICGSGAISNIYGTGFGVDDNIQYSDLPNGKDFDLYLLYQTGLSFPITNNLSLLPLLSFPLINFSNSNPEISQNNQVNAFYSFRTVIMVRYKFSK